MTNQINQKYKKFVAFALNMAKNIDDQEPSSFHEVVTRGIPPQWISSMKEQIEPLYKNQTYELSRKLVDQQIFIQKNSKTDFQIVEARKNLYQGLSQPWG